MSVEYRTGPSGMYRPGTGLREPFYRVSWGGVFAGALLALVINLGLSLFGIGIGLTSGAGSSIWMVLSSIIALFIGGWVASRASEYTTPIKGVFQGVFAWCLVTIAAFFMVTSAAGSLISGLSGITAGVSEFSRTALWGFIGMVLSLGAAALGGRYGITQEPGIEEKETRKAA